MHTNHLLIFDLDDTIFETKSIGQHHVAPALDSFKTSISPLFKTEEVESIMSDLWKYPFDYVSQKYQLNNAIRKQFSDSINSLEYDLDIEVFRDFELVRNINNRKVLVTTGFKKLQLAKISALKLGDVFDEIHVDEIDSTNRIYKKGIFEHLINSENKDLRDFIIIGDNPESEIKAGHELGLTTVQVAKFDQPQSPYATHFVQHFQDLIQILAERS